MRHVSTTAVLIGTVLMALATPSTTQPSIISKAQTTVTENQPKRPDHLLILTGTIVSMNSQIFYLEDDTKNHQYGLDNQALAAKFVGRKVSVTGILDKTDMIHIMNIEEQKA